MDACNTVPSSMFVTDHSASQTKKINNANLFLLSRQKRKEPRFSECFSTCPGLSESFYMDSLNTSLTYTALISTR